MTTDHILCKLSVKDLFHIHQLLLWLRNGLMKCMYVCILSAPSIISPNCRSEIAKFHPYPISLVTLPTCPHLPPSLSYVYFLLPNLTESGTHCNSLLLNFLTKLLHVWRHCSIFPSVLFYCFHCSEYFLEI